MLIPEEALKKYKENHSSFKSPEVTNDYLIKKLFLHVMEGHFLDKEMMKEVRILKEEAGIKLKVTTHDLCKRDQVPGRSAFIFGRKFPQKRCGVLDCWLVCVVGCFVWSLLLLLPNWLLCNGMIRVTCLFVVWGQTQTLPSTAV